ncbi:MAG TPA: hypothetical protein VNP73_09490, partial [Actinomycetota bacterium]|nr:hypothetical protein [Actinomycetota bacterium]
MPEDYPGPSSERRSRTTTPERRAAWRSTRLSGCGAEDGLAYTDDRGPFLDGHLEIPGHPHRQFGRGRHLDGELLPEVPEFREWLARRGRIVEEGSHGHQAPHLDTVQLGHVARQGDRLSGIDAVLCCISSDVDLDQNGLHHAEIHRSTRDGLAYTEPIHRMDQARGADDLTNLVRLKVADEVPPHAVPNHRVLLLELLRPAFADIGDAGFGRRNDHVGRKCLADRHDVDRVRVTV